MIGESQARVKRFASLQRPPCSTMPTLPAGPLPIAYWTLSPNFYWVLAQMGQGKKLYDLGPCHAAPRITSVWYRMEYFMTLRYPRRSREYRGWEGTLPAHRCPPGSSR